MALATASGMSQGSVKSLELGAQRSTSIRTLEALAEALHTDPVWLAFGCARGREIPLPGGGAG